MPTLKNIVLFLIIFFVAGELLVRFDRSTMFFRGERFVNVEQVSNASEELTQLDAGTFLPGPSQYRVMVVGDSFLNGTGVQKDQRFTKILHQVLLKQGVPGYEDVCVLDITLPGSDTRRNTAAFDRYVKPFQPHAVIWAYSLNDVYMKQEPPAQPARTQPSPKSEQDQFNSRLRGVQNALYRNCRLIQYVLPTIHNELKSRGIVIPGSQFDHERSKSHDPDHAPWPRTQEIMNRVWNQCSEDGIQALVLNSPHLDLLSHYSLFDHVDQRIEDYFSTQPVSYIRGVDCFSGSENESFSLSRYDSHPNEKAHRMLAEFTAQRLLKDLSLPN